MAEDGPKIPDEMDLIAFDQLMLADRYDVLMVAGIRIGVDEGRPMITLAFEGRMNHETRRERYNVVMDPRQAFELSGAILDVIEHATQQVREQYKRDHGQ